MTLDIRRTSSSLECIHKKHKLRGALSEISTDEEENGNKHTVEQKLFVHCLNIFFTFLRPWIVDQEKQIQPKFDQYLDLTMKALHIKHDKHLNELVHLAVEKSLKYSYGLEVAVVDTKGLTKAERGKQFLLSLWTCGRRGCLSKPQRNISFRWSTKAKKYVAKKSASAKGLTVVTLQIHEHVINNNEPLCFTLRGCKKRLLSVSTIDEDSMGKFWFKPTQISPEGFHSWVKFTNDASLLIRMRWSLKRSFVHGGSVHFTRSRMKHAELISRLIEYRRTSNSFHGTGGKCRKDCSNVPMAINTETIGLLNKADDIYIDSNGKPRVSRPNDFQIHSNILIRDESLGDQYCICSEWCNIDSFYYYNPIIRWLIVCNHLLSKLDETVGAVYHFSEISKLIVDDNLDCTSILESCCFYLDNEIAKELGKLKYMYIFHETKIALRIFRAYHILREEVCCGVFTNPKDDRITKFMGSFQAYCRIIQWLKVRLHFTDVEMDARLRQRCFASAFAWLKAIVNNPDSVYICKTKLFDSYISYTEDNTSTKDDPLKKYTVNLTMVEEKPKTIIRCKEPLAIILSHKKKSKPSNCKPAPLSLVSGAEAQVEKTDSRTLALNSKSSGGSSAGSNEGPAGVTFILSKGISFLHRFHEIIRTLSDLDTDRIDHFDLKHSEYFWMKVFNESYLGLSQNCPSDLNVGIEDDKKDIKYTNVKKCYILKLYSLAFDFQSLVLETVKCNFGDETGYLVRYEEIAKFFCTNFWIEQVFESTTNQPLYPATYAEFHTLQVLVNSFCQAKHVSSKINDPLSCSSLQKVYINDYELVKANPLLDSADTILIAFKKLVSLQVKAYNDVYDLIKSKSFSIPGVKLQQEEMDTLTTWMVKALGYNIISYVVLLIDNSCKGLDDKEKGHVFPKTVEGWKEIIAVHRVVANLLQSCKGLSANESNVVSRNIRNIKKEVKCMTKLLFKKLCYSWMVDAKDIIKSGDSDASGSKTKAFKIHLVIGCSLVSAFEEDFKLLATAYKADLFGILLGIRDIAKGQACIVFVDNFFQMPKTGKKIFALATVHQFIESSVKAN